MSEVLRIYPGGKNDILDWGVSSIIGTTQIDGIKDDANLNPAYEITSIPSPFARIDLAKSAFKYVAGNKDNKDNKDNNITAFHKIVSECLDVAQIFFDIEKYRDIIEIIVWDKNTHLAELANPNPKCPGHITLADTYRKFLDQDARTYHFDKMDKIYLLNYKAMNAPGEINIIGATSPATLFFTPANNLSYVGKNVIFGNYIPFNADYKALHERDFEFVKFLWSIRLAFPNFANDFEEVDTYLRAEHSKLTEAQKNILNEMSNSNPYEQYVSTAVTPNSQDYVKIHRDFVLRHRAPGNVESGFEMVVSDGKNSSCVPLVLPVDPITAKIWYVSDYWDNNKRAPISDPRPLKERTLPFDRTKYPYVTINDFLENTITRMPYSYNSEMFFDGNFKNKNEKVSYLLPLKPLFFDYFSVKDLMDDIEDNRNQRVKRIEMEIVGDKSVKVTLRIPIKSGDYIQYSRIYSEGNIVDGVGGAITPAEFTLAHYPMIKYPDGVQPRYRITIVEDSINDINHFKLAFYDANNHRVDYFDEPIYRNRNVGGGKMEKNYADPAVYVLEKEYDYMTVSNEKNLSIRGIVVPKFEQKNGGKSFKFAIDFGTTNTHIEYISDGMEESKALDITKDDIQIHKLHKHDQLENVINYQVVFNGDMMPDLIGGSSEYNYPMRTVLLESKNIKKDARITMANVNIPFIYERKRLPRYNNVPPYTNLKWSIDSTDQKRAKVYIESILEILRNKVLLNDGKLSKTKIVWFYPASMSPGRWGNFNKPWKDAYHEIFGGEPENVQTMSESVAPYLYNKTTEGATSTVVSVDIGGGTTDVLIAEKGEPRYITSFGFAANTIWGDGYAYNANTNGFVNKYKPIFEEKFKDGGELKALKPVYEDLFRTTLVSTDIIAFFFSLLSNKELVEKKIKVDFGSMLSSDQRCNYIILLFYTAIMYHIAQIMKTKQIGMPRHISFSGNGSKVLQILTSENSFLEGYTKKIFEGVYGEPYSCDGLTIIPPESGAKESTCKGGIIAKTDDMKDYNSIKRMKTVLTGCDAVTFADGLTYDDVDSDSTLQSKVVENVNAFIDFFFNLHKEYSFSEYFNVDSSIMKQVYEICKKDIANYFNDGLKKRKNSNKAEGVGAENKVEETLFFYPLVGIINAVAREIYKLK